MTKTQRELLEIDCDLVPSNQNVWCYQDDRDAGINRVRIAIDDNANNVIEFLGKQSVDLVGGICTLLNSYYGSQK